MTFPELSKAVKLEPSSKRVFIGAYGFEKRSLGWLHYQRKQGCILKDALIFQYTHPKGENLIDELRKGLQVLCAGVIQEISYDASVPHAIEDIIEAPYRRYLKGVEEVVVDISAMTKLLILITLLKLRSFNGTVRLVYSEAADYSPTSTEYEKSKKGMKTIAKFPSRGFESVVRTKALGSIRMQGQPVSMIAFTSFNEQLVRHMLGTINPHRLLFINGRPPRRDYRWREKATQEIHKQLTDDYAADNPIGPRGLLARRASTLDYSETIARINKIYCQFGTHERIICAATGSKMQTVGLFFAKVAHPDIHVEYPTPNSYFVEGLSFGVRKIHEVVFERFSDFCAEVSRSSAEGA